jgi:hypothetical protein
MGSNYISPFLRLCECHAVSIRLGWHMNWKDLEGSSHGLIVVQSQKIARRGWGRPRQIPVSIASGPAEIRTESLQNTNQKSYRLSHLDLSLNGKSNGTYSNRWPLKGYAVHVLNSNTYTVISSCLRVLSSIPLFCSSVWVRNLVSHIKGRKYIEGIWEQGGEGIHNLYFPRVLLK